MSYYFTVFFLFCSFFFFFNDTATTEIYTLSLHDALPFCVERRAAQRRLVAVGLWAAIESAGGQQQERPELGHKDRLEDEAHDREHALRAAGGAQCMFTIIDRKSTRLNSSHT